MSFTIIFLVERILWAWVLTPVAAGSFGYFFVRAAQAVGWIP